MFIIPYGWVVVVLVFGVLVWKTVHRDEKRRGYLLIAILAGAVVAQAVVARKDAHKSRRIVAEQQMKPGIETGFASVKGGG